MEKKTLKKIIFVDDDHDILTVSKYCLENMAGVEIKFLDSGDQAINEALYFQPDLIILDVMMPGMDGISAFNAMKLQPTIASIPVVFITARLQKSEIDKYLSIGVIGVIKKPFDPLTLSDTI